MASPVLRLAKSQWACRAGMPGAPLLSPPSLVSPVFPCRVLTVFRSKARLGLAPSLAPMRGSAQPDDKFASASDTSSGVRGLEQDELDSALQLLVERAQYITGATGTALALPQGDEMVCRASAGSSAPAIGARLQVRSGLTGESMSRGQLLRCDNAEADPRVNLEACRALGIASIVVLPLLRRSGEVRGLFELFSDHPYAFEERDLIALERMATLTATALDLAEQRQNMPAAPGEERKGSIEAPSVSVAPAADAAPLQSPPVLEVDEDEDRILSDEPSTVELKAEPTADIGPAVIEPAIVQSTVTEPTIVEPGAVKSAAARSQPVLPERETFQPEPAALSAAVVPTETTDNLRSQAERSPVFETVSEPASIPEAMRRVQKCATCGFPVSEGRTFCLDCEKKDTQKKEFEKRQGEKQGEKKNRHEHPTTLSVQGKSETSNTTAATSQVSSEEFVPRFLADSVPVEESWLSNHVNLLALVVLIMGILIAVVVFR
jgi:GAF domain-containing protein